ncbi:hypothetical protein PPROV_000864900 [Pycnococcus provasolii]|uniref:S1 motif domain-containing protein n=1 Tax=Pycnococcus provasolii TaxID=41880 RepID=A0A830HT91_9CHLO|nr:hypothetical protein PPROV_000864900 [Pycnococcus provasolii]
MDDSLPLFPRGGGGASDASARTSSASKKRAASGTRTHASASHSKQTKARRSLLNISRRDEDVQEELASLADDDLPLAAMAASSAELESITAASSKKIVGTLRFHKLVPGMKLLGCITSITPQGVVVALPQGLKGFCTLREACERSLVEAAYAHGDGNLAVHMRNAVAASFPIGAFVPCIVSDISEDDGDDGEQTVAADATENGGDERMGKRKRARRVLVSFRLAKLRKRCSAASLARGRAVMAAVVSAEDHGYAVSLGINGCTSFLPYSTIPQGSPRLPAGAIVRTAVTSIRKRGAAGVHVEVKLVGGDARGHSLAEDAGVTLDELVPGDVVNATVSRVLADGMHATFCSFFRATVDAFHLTTPGASLSEYAVGQKHAAVILSVDAAAKEVRLSLLEEHVRSQLCATAGPHALTGSPDEYAAAVRAALSGDAATSTALPGVGTKMENLVVARTEEKVGLALRMGEDGGFAFVHVSHVSAQEVSKLAKRFPIGALIANPARVIDVRPMEHVVAMSMLPEDVSNDNLMTPIHTFAPGDLVQGCVVRGYSKRKGVLHITVGGKHFGFVPTNWMDAMRRLAFLETGEEFEDGGRDDDDDDDDDDNYNKNESGARASLKSSARGSKKEMARLAKRERARQLAMKRQKRLQRSLYQPGELISVRIVSVDYERRRLKCATMKELVGSNLAVVGDTPLELSGDEHPARAFTNAELRASDVWAHGVVTGVLDSPKPMVFVAFYGRAKGLASGVETLGLGEGERPSDMFKVGRVTRVRLHARLVGKRYRDEQMYALSYVPRSEEEIMAASALGKRDAATAGSDEPRAKRSRASLQVGDACSGTVKDCDATTGVIRLKMDSGDGAAGLLDRAHIVDHVGMRDMEWGSLAPGSRIDGLRVLARRSATGTVVVTAKSTITAAMADSASFPWSLPRRADELQVGRMCVGYVRKIMYAKGEGTVVGLLVAFQGALCGFARPSELVVYPDMAIGRMIPENSDDDTDEDLSYDMLVGASVLCRVKEAGVRGGDGDRARSAVLEILAVEGGAPAAGRAEGTTPVASLLERSSDDELAIRRFATQSLDALLRATGSGDGDGDFPPPGATVSVRSVEQIDGIGGTLVLGELGLRSKTTKKKSVDRFPNVATVACNAEDVEVGEGAQARRARVLSVNASDRVVDVWYLDGKAKEEMEDDGASAVAKLRDGGRYHATIALIKQGLGYGCAFVGRDAAKARDTTDEGSMPLCYFALRGGVNTSLDVGDAVTVELAADGVSACDERGGRVLGQLISVDRQLPNGDEAIAGPSSGVGAQPAPRRMFASSARPGAAVVPAVVATPVQLAGGSYASVEMASGPALAHILHVATAKAVRKSLSVSDSSPDGSLVSASSLVEAGHEVELASLRRGTVAGGGGMKSTSILALRGEKEGHQAAEAVLRVGKVRGRKGGFPVVEAVSSDALATGDVVVGVVESLADDETHGVIVSLCDGVRGIVALVDSFRESPQPDDVHAAPLSRRMPVGALVACRVLSRTLRPPRLALSMNVASSFDEDGMDAEGGEPPSRVGEIVRGTVRRITDDACSAELAIDGGSRARVDLFDLSDGALVSNPLARADADPPLTSRPDCVVVARVLRDNGEGRIDVSLKPSLGGAGAEEAFSLVDGDVRKGKAARVLMATPRVGAVRLAAVKASGPKGVFVRLADGVEARCLLKNLSHRRVTNVAKTFFRGKMVACRVLSCDVDTGRVEVEFRSTEELGDVSQLSVEDIRRVAEDVWKPLGAYNEGEPVRGVVTRVEKFGVFVRVAGSSDVTGLVHRSHVGGSMAQIVVGTDVSCVVLAVDAEKRKMALSMDLEQHHLDGDGEEEEEEEDGLEEEEEDDLEEEEDDLEEDDMEEEEEEEEEEEDDDDDGEEDEEEDARFGVDTSALMTLDAVAGEGGNAASLLTGSGAFDFDATLDAEMDNGAAEDVDMQTDAPLDPAAEARRKKKERKDRERRALEHETRLRREMGGGESRVPSSAEDFEELVAQSPESSYLWVRYMAFALGTGDASLARRIVERALASVPLEETSERFNLFVARLNLEKQHGDAASMKAAVMEACARSDEKRILVALFAIEQKHGDVEGMSAASARLVKRFGASCKAWVKTYIAALSASKGTDDVLARAMTRLPTRKHVKFLSACAAHACGEDEMEAGRGLYEKLVATYPKRLDVWLRYADAEEKLCVHAPSDEHRRRVRALYARIETMPLPVKKMKTVFQNELKFETSKSGEKNESRRNARCEDVKKRAMAWVDENTNE